jgi:hypothetical protein
MGQLLQLVPPLHFDSGTFDSVRNTWAKSGTPVSAANSLHSFVWDFRASRRLGGTDS